MSADIFDRARRIAAASGGRLTFREALAQLGKRGCEARKRGKARNLGGFTAAEARGAFARVESPRGYWWDRD